MYWKCSFIWLCALYVCTHIIWYELGRSLLFFFLLHVVITHGDSFFKPPPFWFLIGQNIVFRFWWIWKSGRNPWKHTFIYIFKTCLFFRMLMPYFIFFLRESIGMWVAAKYFHTSMLMFNPLKRETIHNMYRFAKVLFVHQAWRLLF